MKGIVFCHKFRCGGNNISSFALANGARIRKCFEIMWLNFSEGVKVVDEW